MCDINNKKNPRYYFVIWATEMAQHVKMLASNLII